MKNFSVMTDFKLYSYQFGSRFIALFLAVVKILMNMVYMANILLKSYNLHNLSHIFPYMGWDPSQFE
jgi:hypothetical protein